MVPPPTYSSDYDCCDATKDRASVVRYKQTTENQDDTDQAQSFPLFARFLNRYIIAIIEHGRNP
jgi:hypothetical protein